MDIENELRLIYAIDVNKKAIKRLKSQVPKSQERSIRIKAHKLLIQKYQLALKDLKL